MASISACNPKLSAILKAIPIALETLTELNLAVFYIRGVYYDGLKRLLGVRHVCMFAAYYAVVFDNIVNRSHHYPRIHTHDLPPIRYWVCLLSPDYYTD